jgi:hypothetical protein
MLIFSLRTYTEYDGSDEQGCPKAPSPAWFVAEEGIGGEGGVRTGV